MMFHWGRFLSAQGHKPKRIAAHFVAPFRKSRGAKNDRNDAEAILAAVRQPDMRFVSVSRSSNRRCWRGIARAVTTAWSAQRC